MHVKDAIGTEKNVTLYANWRYRRSRYKRILNYIEQMYKRFLASFGLDEKG